MIFVATSIEGAWTIDLEPHADIRGFFARSWCRRELIEHGLDSEIAQESISYNRVSGTVRGMHFQREPHEETKIVRCIRGAIFDVMVDLRPKSPSFLQWVGIELTAQNRRGVYIPKGVAHGFQTLTNDTEIVYQISAFHEPGAAEGCRYDEPAFRIVWPLPVSVVSDRDLEWPAFGSNRAGVLGAS